jgi:hypothetical protein
MYGVAMSSSYSNLLKETEGNGFNGDVLRFCFGRVICKQCCRGMELGMMLTRS